MVIGACIILFYTMMGGFFAVAWTDFFQGLVMVVTLVVLPVAGIISLGGVTQWISGIGDKDPALLSLWGSDRGWTMMKVVLGGLGIGLGYMGQPHLLARFMAIRDPDRLRQGTAIALVWAVLSFSGAVLVGTVGILHFQQTPADQEQVMPMLASALLPAWLAGIAISGAIAAMMSTADSQLLVTTSALSEDIYHRMIRPEAPEKRLLFLSRLGTVLVGAAAFFLAIRAEALVYDLVLYAWAGLGASFGPVLLLSLWWKGVTRQGALAGMLTGMATVLLWYNVPVLRHTLYELIPGFFLALLAVWCVSLFTGSE